MSNKQKVIDELINSWQQQLQESLNDPKIAELMTNYYAKFQDNIQKATECFTNQSSPDDVNGDNDSDQLAARVEKLEVRIALLEKLLVTALK